MFPLKRRGELSDHEMRVEDDLNVFFSSNLPPPQTLGFCESKDFIENGFIIIHKSSEYDNQS